MPLDHLRLARRLGRVAAACNKRHKYTLGAGGMSPSSEFPGELRSDGFRHCDCTGYGAWGLEISRHQAGKGKPWSAAIPWIESTAIANDATGKQLLFKQLSAPVKGCCAVYGDSFATRTVKRIINGVSKLVTKREKLGEGHFMFVESFKVKNGKVVELWGYDCSPSNFRKGGNAIAYRNISFALKKKLVFCVLGEDFVG